MASAHPLRLVSPWYRWRRQAEADGLLPRRSRPVFQKYDSPTLVNRFLEDPQASYRFLDQDEVHITEGSPYAGEIRSVADRVRRPCGLRKLFRNTHKRHYLVVAALHCDLPGFPDARLEHQCEVGFVVRRRAPDPSLQREEARREVQERIGVVRAQILRITALRLNADPPDGLRPEPPDEPLPPPPFGGSLWNRAVELALYRERLRVLLQRYRAELRGLRTRLCALERLEGAEWPWAREGWIPDAEHESQGRWSPADEFPQEVEEQVHPLTPLIPDPRFRDHSSHGARLFFGLVPTDSGETDEDGEPRFQAGHVYEIRLFVRRHREGCPRTPEPGDCSGPLVWSEYTEPYRIAAHGDLDGTKNCTVTVEMPDVEELAAQSASLPPGGAGGVRMRAPKGSSLHVENGKLGGAETCSLPVPLITLVASFLLRATLPVVVFVLGLFFLLRLKVCIPPSFQVDPELAQEIAAAGPELDDDEDLTDELVAALDEAFPEGPDGKGLGERLAAEYTNSELWEMLQDLAGETDPPAAPPVPGDLVLEERVEPRPRVDDPGLAEAAG